MFVPSLFKRCHAALALFFFLFRKEIALNQRGGKNASPAPDPHPQLLFFAALIFAVFKEIEAMQKMPG